MTRFVVACLFLAMAMANAAFAGDNPLPGKTLIQGSSADGYIWSVRKTNVKGSYYWYMGESGRHLAKIKEYNPADKDFFVYVNGTVYHMKDLEVVVTEDGTDNLLPKGSLGYRLYMETLKDALGIKD